MEQKPVIKKLTDLFEGYKRKYLLIREKQTVRDAEKREALLRRHVLLHAPKEERRRMKQEDRELRKQKRRQKRAEKKQNRLSFAQRRQIRKAKRKARREWFSNVLARFRSWFRNLSLRVSFMMYMVIFAGLGLFTLLAASGIINEIRTDILSGYVDPYESISYYYVRGSTLIIEYTDGVMGQQELGAFDRAAVALLEALPGVVGLASIVGCVVVAGVMFSRHKLKRPITELMAASARISENNLDFHITYDNKDEMGRLCRSFESMRAELEHNHQEMWRQIEERKRLNAAFSHDLRTPLTVLRGHTDMLIKYLPEGRISGEKAVETLQTLSSHILRLEKYTDAMNRMQRLEDIEIRRASVDRADFMQGLRESAEYLAEGKALHFVDACDAGVICIDSACVMQVYENLIANAVRYARDAIVVQCRMRGDTFMISVSDDGPGFSEKDIIKATNPFYKATENIYDTHFGLGLHICKIICERHGGDLKLGKGPDGGAEVVASFR